jgi:hypothetical protein
MIYYYGFWGADVTQIMMMNICKITAISINFRDGGVTKEKRETELKSSKITRTRFLNGSVTRFNGSMIQSYRGERILS